MDIDWGMYCVHVDIYILHVNEAIELCLERCNDVTQKRLLFSCGDVYAFYSYPFMNDVLLLHITEYGAMAYSCFSHEDMTSHYTSTRKVVGSNFASTR